MLRDRVRIGLQAGLIGAASVIGVLLGFGWRRGVPARPFNDAAALILGARARQLWGFDAAATLAGMVIYLAAALLLGVAFALVAATWTGWRLAVAAAALAGVAFLLHIAVVGSGGTPPALGVPHAIMASLALASAVAAGTRIAQLPRREA